MLSRDHFMLSILSVIILFGWLFFQNALFFLAISLGVFVGCFLPDTDLPRSKIDHMKGVPGFFGVITKHILNPLVALFFEWVLKKPIDRGHRGITHTVYGISTYCLLIEGAGLLGILVLGWWQFIAGFSLFVFGLFFGGILHLMEDACTKTGVSPFYPINEGRKYSGTISTYDVNEMRPKLFTFILLAGAVILFVLQVYSGLPMVVMIGLSVAFFFIFWKIFFTLSTK